MRHDRGSEATEAIFCLHAKKPLHSGSYEHRVPKIKTKHFLYTCVIQHRNWPLRSTILNAHGTNASPDGLCTRTHTNEAFSGWYYYYYENLLYFTYHRSIAWSGALLEGLEFKPPSSARTKGDIYVPGTYTNIFFLIFRLMGYTNIFFFLSGVHFIFKN